MVNPVLLENEKQANRVVAKVMRITFLIFTVVYLLNVFGIFVVDMKIMTFAYGVGSVFLWLPTILVNLCKQQGGWVKYVNVLCAVFFVTMAVTTLTYHVVVLYIYAIAIASLYFSRQLNIFVTVLSVFGVSIGQIAAFYLQTLPDKNLTVLKSVLIYGVVPRALILIAIAAIFIMLCQRTASMLGNLMGAEEQRLVLEQMQQMKEQSAATAGNLNHMVEELSVITDSSIKANEQIAQETERMLLGFSDNTQQLERTNVSIQDISTQLEELSTMNHQIASLAEQVNSKTKENQDKMISATQSMQQIQDSTEDCKQHMNKLGQESTEILGIIQVITGISARTNILALNASIEAARAGEHGRGFAVVASEIQKLSEQTKSAVEEIADIIHQVVQDTEQTKSAMEQNASLTKEGMKTIREAESSATVITASNNEMTTQILSMDEIAELVRERSREVAASMKQVSENMQESYESIEHVTAATQENTAGTENIAAMVQQIQSLAEELADM